MPTGAKSQALIALLATSANFERSRTWIQDKLWSDRAPEQGASSVRQSIYKIKAALGPLADIVRADRTSIQLDAKNVEVIIDPNMGEFLEGLDVRDQEFESWLLQMRTELNQDRQTSSVPAFGFGRVTSPPRKVIIKGVSDQNSEMAVEEHVLIDLLSLSLRENQSVEIDLNGENAQDQSAILVSFRCFELGEQALSLRVVAEDLRRNAVIMSETLRITGDKPSNQMDSTVLNLCNRLIEIVQDYAAIKSAPLPYDSDASLLANIAVRKIFSISPDDLSTAETLLEQAYSIEQRGVFQAWHAQALVIKHIERFDCDQEALVEQADALCAAALAADPTNSNVLAAVANARCMIDRNVVAALELAKLAVRVNPGNPLAWWALSNGFGYAGKADLAYQSALHSHKLARNTRMKFWTDIQRALTAIALGKTEEAVTYCELSSALAPNFRPPKRYLAALYADRNEFQKANGALQSLAKMEPGFSLEQMHSDPDYPVGLMRLSGLTESLKKIA